MTVYQYIKNEMRLAEITEVKACNGTIKGQCQFKIMFYENLLKLLPIAALGLNIVENPHAEIPSEELVMTQGKILPVTKYFGDGHEEINLDAE